jgi:hypothetical protein
MYLPTFLRKPVEIVNLVLTIFVPPEILLGLWKCFPARQGGFAL